MQVLLGASAKLELVDKFCCLGDMLSVDGDAEKMMMMIGYAWSMKLRALDQGEDQRGPGERLSERTVKHGN